jgi:hypothetical protein
MPDMLKYVIDAVAAAALFLALLVVFAVDWALTPSSGPAQNTLAGVKVIESKSGAVKKLRLAVTPTARTRNLQTNKDEKWDDMGKLLKELGEGYNKFDEVTEQQILQGTKKLSDYDVLFLTCAPGGEALNNQLRDYVSGGGVVYASDWRFDAIAAAFPEMVSQKLRGEGEKQELSAEIVDKDLRHALGDVMNVKLKFDLAEWKTAAFSGPRVTTLMQGTYLKNKSNQRATAPLLVKFTFNKGTVIFTSFHNEKQNSRVEKELLRYLVFSLVTEDVLAEMTAKMEGGGFAPQKSNLLSTPAKNQTTEPKYYENSRRTTLQFALGFRNEGAKLRFNIKSPSGEQYTWEGSSTVILEVPNAEPGRWTYTVTALDLPYAEFAFRFAVAEKK